ncbi:hypothetical protein [Telmatospirillum siberiense]|uniref:Alkylhydroperoxidase n=1 Tax=Telmatospirillum siberiense TaxID=382514 RepID=A0A2N3PQI9_9PROT|nr:hypothetical protein [Telmatospirillum siberiense]PKU22667.1 hypothetical protein CWS72_20255 [Telmatospirillum siberiense]
MSIISPVDPDRLDDQRRQAFQDEVTRVGQVTNMKRAILHSLPAYRTYKEFYALQLATRQLVGERAFNIFAYAISSGSDCLLCSTFFRRLLRESGIDPKDFEPTAVEKILIDIGGAIGRGERALPQETQARLRQHFDEAGIVTLVAFAGTMVATNIFNSVLEIDLDDYLQGYQDA